MSRRLGKPVAYSGGWIGGPSVLEAEMDHLCVSIDRYIPRAANGFSATAAIAEVTGLSEARVPPWRARFFQLRIVQIHQLKTATEVSDAALARRDVWNNGCDQ